MEQLKSRQGQEDQERIQIERPETWWEILKDPHITAKELKKIEAGTGTSNNKDLHGR